MRRHVAAIALLLVVMCALSALAADEGKKIYGKITTTQGDTFEGFIRWDKNEGTWIDMLDGTRDRVPAETSERRRYGRSHSSRYERDGIKIVNSWTSSGRESQSGVRFGHIKALEVVGDDRALLTLKSGEEVEFEGGSTDLGTDVREIVIEDKDEGEIELVWEDLDKIEFMAPPSSATSNSGERLFGTLTTRRGESFTGYITWDVDEIFSKDIVDGEEHGRRRRVPFSRISAIARYSSSGSELTLTNGDKMVLKGTNDVDESNRGIIVSDLKLGDVEVDWDDFDMVQFQSPTFSFSYADFDGGVPLHGTVYTEDGDSYTGDIQWDDDESQTWELLNGNLRSASFEIEFGQIAQIERNGYRSSEVTLKDGRVFRLSESNDVDESNKGIFIKTPEGNVQEVDWDDFARVAFVKK